MKKTTLLSLCLIIFNLGFSQTTLTEGDIAITGVISVNPDQFSFVLLTDVLSGTEIHFTDKNWLPTGGKFSTIGEGTVTWTATTDLPCGTAITITDTGHITENTYSATIGNVIESELGFTLNEASGDEISAFQGSEQTPTFLYAIHFGNTLGWADTDANVTANRSGVPAGLTNSVNAMNMGNFENGTFNCTTTSNKTLILADVVQPSNWTRTNGAITLTACSYTCSTPTPCLTTVVYDHSGWSGTPDLTTEVQILADYSTSLGSFKTCKLTIGSGTSFIVENNTYVEIENDVIVNGNLIVETQANFVQNNKNGTFTVNNPGISQVNKITPIKNEWYHYTYWSSPVNAENIDHAFPDVDNDRTYLFNAENFIDNNGDDIDDDGNDWQVIPGGHIMTPGVGYACMSSRTLTYPSTQSVSFKGAFNTGDITTNITKNISNTGTPWNLIGNPYPSAIDFVAFQQANATVIDGAAYFWSHATEHHASHPGNEQSNFHQNDYATFTIGSGGAAGSSGIIPNKYITTGQGFFVPGLTNGTVTFRNAMRVADEMSNTQFLKHSDVKKESNPLENKLWINLTTNQGVFSQILIAYVDGATETDDGLFYDATRIVNQGFSAILYSSIDINNKKYVIQGKGLNNINESENIKLGFSTKINTSTIYKLELDQFQGEFLSKNNIYLKDNLTNTIHNLSDTAYTFTSEIGEFNNRFEIVFDNNSLSAETFSATNQIQIIALENHNFQFNSAEKAINNIQIFNILGQNLYNLKGGGTSKTYLLPDLSPIFIAKIELASGEVVSVKGIH
ncbi:hypothetical protein Q4566_06665 [Tamlana sp. 2_MG-2023]|uniref:hypothetical protein n=1 Tax=unclassified Tamlana TaxID=2614803 RepID=UPI0026E20E94|nr:MULTISPECIES: hypothetical protein [unclassified Tamlana]MDO6759878.1 hypothetical protein [Tamlana sp. 2_MG-2023]MDO6791952.1 hypothetical protein [Tamlana sp. 1_MG-2023]